MDLDIARSLGELQSRKLEIETGTDLSNHCDTLVELDTKVGGLMSEVSALRVELEQRFGFMEERCNQLGPPYQTLLMADQVLDMVIGLNRLNKICKRFETNPNFVRTENDGLKIGIKSLQRLTGGDEENTDLDGDDKSTLIMILDLLDSFENAYKPLEDLLCKRDDLPYANYAKKVRNLDQSLNKLRARLRSR